MSEPQTADRVHLDAAVLTRVVDLASLTGERLYKIVLARFARNKDATAITLFTFAICAMLGRAIQAFPDTDSITGQINALWRVLGVPFRVRIDRVQ
jgi:hypothetical protein